MLIKNPTKDAVPSDITPEEFGHAMARLDLTSIPPEHRFRALREHMRRIMIGSITDPATKHRLAEAAIKDRR